MLIRKQSSCCARTDRLASATFGLAVKMAADEDGSEATPPAFTRMRSENAKLVAPPPPTPKLLAQAAKKKEEEEILATLGSMRATLSTGTQPFPSQTVALGPAHRKCDVLLPQHTGHLACSMQLTPSAYPHSLTHVQLLAGLRRCWEAQPADPVAWLGEWLAQRAATSTGSTAASHAGVSARSVTAARSHGMVFHGNISRGSSLTASCSCCGTGHAAAY